MNTMAPEAERGSDQQRPTHRSAADRLRQTMAASRLGFTWFGATRSLTDSQKETAARSFGADSHVLSAGKKLLDTRHPAFKEVNSVKSRITAYWKGDTLPYPQPGLRLIRQDDIERFNQRLIQFQGELDEAVVALEAQYVQLKQAARLRLADLFNESDYPASLRGLFSVQWDFPSIEVPDYLQRLNPRLYQQEAARVARRFDEALELAESAFMQELSELIEHLGERLSGQADGKPKVFRDSAIHNLTQFFDRFRRLNVRSHPELDRLVDSCQQIVQGRSPQSLRRNRLLRDAVATELQSVGSQLDQLLVERPRRHLIRPER